MAEDLFGSATIERITAHFQRPANLDTLLAYAERMAPKDMTFLRVDFFMLSDGTFVLGEGAAYSAGGGVHAKPRVELELGQIFFGVPFKIKPSSTRGGEGLPERLRLVDGCSVPAEAWETAPNSR